MERTKLFSIILKEAVNTNYRGNLSTATQYLNDNSCPIDYSTMRSYVGNYTIPDYTKAEQILTTLGYPITQEELLSSLEYSSKQLFEKEIEKKYYITSIRINPNKIEEGMSVDDFQSYIQGRCLDIFDDENKGFGAYIQHLIKKDMKGKK